MAETQAYIAKIMATQAARLLDDSTASALLLEDLQSPCTEEVAVFHAFSRVVNEARTRLCGAGHRAHRPQPAADGRHRRLPPPDERRQYEGSAGGATAKHIVTPLMRLQDADMTHVVIVTLPEVTPVSQAQPCRKTCAAPTSSPGMGHQQKRGCHGHF